jgi:hypothetical protein
MLLNDENNVPCVYIAEYNIFVLRNISLQILASIWPFIFGEEGCQTMTCTDSLIDLRVIVLFTITTAL